MPDLHLRTTDEMLDEFSFVKDEHIRNDIVINNAYKFIEEVENNLQPVKDKPYRPNIPGVDDKLINLVHNSAHGLYGDKIPEEIKTRIDHELKMITSNGYSVIY
jgi:DNA polymerase-3 subunit alpha (Gram-positive type)